MFFSTEGDVVYEAAQADLTVQDVDQLVDFGLSWTPYKMVDGRYYTPAKELNMVSMELPIGEYTVEQMQRSLFFDPSITRNIREKDGSEIYTDSKRSLQVDQGQNGSVIPIRLRRHPVRAAPARMCCRPSIS